MCVVCTNGAQWNYDLQDPHGPEHWGQDCKTGSKQSPIDIHDKEVEKSMMSSLEFTNYEVAPQSMQLLNNGHTVKLIFKPASEGFPLMHGGGLGSEYRLAQIHFHWGSADTQGSEHKINNQSYPMEMHLVHFQDSYDELSTALSDLHQKTLAVLGVFFQVSEEDNPLFDSLLSGVDGPQGSAAQIDVFPFSDLLPEDLSKFYRYNGSLTTPGCFEIVQWTVVKDPVKISQNQLNKFRQVKQKDGTLIAGNFRPTQSIGKRRILDVTTFSDTEPGSLAADLVPLACTGILSFVLAGWQMI